MKNDNAHAIRFVESLKSNISETVAKDFEEKYQLSKSADIQLGNICMQLS